MIRVLLISMRLLTRFQKLTTATRTTNQTHSVLGIRSTLVLLVVLLSIVATACSDDAEFHFVRGRSVEIHVGNPVIKSKMSFQDDDGRHHVIRPKASNRQLALVEVVVVNRTSTVMPLLVDGDAAQLGDRRGERIDALDPFSNSRIVEIADENEGEFAPLLWGDVQLDRQFQVQGWMIFDVPKGLLLSSVWWNEIDDVIVDYVSYFRN
jgi:hypothetical protein